MNDEMICNGDRDAIVSTDRGLSSHEPTNGHAHAAADYLSPALLRTGKTAPAYEMKFVVTPTLADRVRAWAPAHLVVDPHVDTTRGDAYQIRSIYFDTERLDVFHRTPTFKRRKFRLRRYGNDPGIFLERKTKSGDRVSKRRTAIAPEELVRLLDATTDAAWAGYWFHKKLLARQLKPRCLVNYERVAYVGTTPDGPVRLTLDRDIRCLLTDGWDLNLAGEGLPLLTDEVVLELKFCAAMPALFKGLIQELNVNPGRASKYRLGIQAHGLAKEPS